MTSGNRPLPGGRLFRTLPLLGVMAIIFALSHVPGDSLSLPHFPGADKLAHGVAYGALAASAMLASSPLSQRIPGMLYGSGIVIFCLTYGISDEWHQSFIPGRMASGFDLLADTLGALVVVLGWCRLKTRLRASPC